MNTGLFAQVYRVVRQVPFGRVTTYGQIAGLIGSPRASRAVGYALHCAPPDVPCHRVVNRLGELSDAFTPSGRETHRLLLEAEGVPFRADGRVLLEECCWSGTEPDGFL